MQFVKTDGHEQVDVATRRRRCRAQRGPAERRILRDRAMLLLSGAGLTPTEISQVALAFAEGCRNRSYISYRIRQAQRLAARQAQGA